MTALQVAAVYGRWAEAKELARAGASWEDVLAVDPSELPREAQWAKPALAVAEWFMISKSQLNAAGCASCASCSYADGGYGDDFPQVDEDKSDVAFGEARFASDRRFAEQCSQTALDAGECLPRIRRLCGVIDGVTLHGFITRGEARCLLIWLRHDTDVPVASRLAATDAQNRTAMEYAVEQREWAAMHVLHLYTTGAGARSLPPGLSPAADPLGGLPDAAAWAVPMMAAGGWDIEARDSAYDSTPLELALSWKRFRLADALLKAGADPEARGTPGGAAARVAEERTGARTLRRRVHLV